MSKSDRKGHNRQAHLARRLEAGVEASALFPAASQLVAQHLDTAKTEQTWFADMKGSVSSSLYLKSQRQTE